LQSLEFDLGPDRAPRVLIKSDLAPDRALGVLIRSDLGPDRALRVLNDPAGGGSHEKTLDVTGSGACAPGSRSDLRLPAGELEDRGARGGSRGLAGLCRFEPGFGGALPGQPAPLRLRPGGAAGDRRGGTPAGGQADPRRPHLREPAGRDGPCHADRAPRSGPLRRCGPPARPALEPAGSDRARGDLRPHGGGGRPHRRPLLPGPGAPPNVP